MQVEQINQYKHEIEVLTTTVTAETSSLKQCRHLVTELQTTNQELVTRLKVKGRELSQVEGVQKRKDESATVRTQSLEDQVLGLQRMEQQLKHQLRDMATTNSELLARLTAHAATSATSRLEARTIRQEADTLKQQMLSALSDNETTLQASFVEETARAAQTHELARMEQELHACQLALQTREETVNGLETQLHALTTTHQELEERHLDTCQRLTTTSLHVEQEHTQALAALRAEFNQRREAPEERGERPEGALVAQVAQLQLELATVRRGKKDGGGGGGGGASVSTVVPLQEMTHRLEQVTMEHAQLQQQVVFLETTRTKHNTDIEGYRSQLNDLQTQLIAAQHAQKDERYKYERANTEVARLTTHVKDMQEDIEVAKAAAAAAVLREKGKGYYCM
jgi:predicted  nucleic acid-binding Zn-ribbon protein